MSFNSVNMAYFLASIFIIGSCGGGTGGEDRQESRSNNGGGEGAGVPAGSSGPDCSLTIEGLMRNISDNPPANIPSWEQLDCYTNGLVRQANEDYVVMLGRKPPRAEDVVEPYPSSWEIVQNGIEFYRYWPESNTFDFRFNEVPPYYTQGSESFTAEEWEHKQRGIMAKGIYLKSLDYPLVFSYFTPPADFNVYTPPYESSQSAEHLLELWRTIYIPERVALAKIAEKIQAEAYQPWDIEPGQFLRSSADAWIEDISVSQQVAVVQEMADTLLAALREEFTGKLIVTNYDRFAAHGEEWKNLDLSRWDQVNFALFTEGDVEATERYLTNQLSGYQEMVASHNIDNWIIQEITVDPVTHQRLLPEGQSFEAIEADIYSAIFDALESMTAKPNGFGMSVGHIKTAEAEEVVRRRIPLLKSVGIGDE